VELHERFKVVALLVCLFDFSRREEVLLHI
jgi:hypothetical protein